MTFLNEKKMYLAKQDKSKKGDIDEKVIPLLRIINAHDNYYTTSSCSGRVYLWTGSGKKNETKWIKVSHDVIDETFFTISDTKGVVWLRVEAFILHVACKDLNAANVFLEKAKKIYKKSCILSASNKIIVEIRGSEMIEMPLYKEGVLLYQKEFLWLRDFINSKLRQIWNNTEKFKRLFTF